MIYWIFYCIDHFICPNQARKLLDDVLKILRHQTADWEAFKIEWGVKRTGCQILIMPQL